MVEITIVAYDKEGNEIDYAMYDTDYTITTIKES